MKKSKLHVISVVISEPTWNELNKIVKEMNNNRSDVGAYTKSRCAREALIGFIKIYNQEKKK